MQYLQGYGTSHKAIVFKKVTAKNGSKEPPLGKHEIEAGITCAAYSEFCPDQCVKHCFLLCCGVAGL